jgi:ParB family chromosome partitioning protein
MLDDATRRINHLAEEASSLIYLELFYLEFFPLEIEICRPWRYLYPNPRRFKVITKVKVDDIVPNPFQARKGYEREGIRTLADEIKTVGLWPGALRGRKRAGKVELCFGHRRLAAVKLLGWREVDVDVVELSDDEMATQSLIENLQREGLNDVEKAEGIVALVRRLQRSTGKNENPAIQEVSSKLGLSPSWTKELMRIAEFDEPAKEAIRAGKIAGRTALEAYRIGGSKMIEVAAEKKLPVHTLTAIGQRISEISDPAIREKVKRSVLKGDVVVPDEIKTKARQMTARSQQDKAPPDLVIVITRWTGFIEDWTKQLDAVLPYREYVDSVPKIADRFRTSVRSLIQRLEKLL